MNASYLSRTEYTSLTGADAPSNFAMLEIAARKRVDYLTASRVAPMAEVPEAVKACMAALIQLDATTGAVAQATAPVVTSFSTDGYSESYGHAFSAGESANEMKNLIKVYLYGVKDDRGIPLLYRGVEHDEAL